MDWGTQTLLAIAKCLGSSELSKQAPNYSSCLHRTLPAFLWPQKGGWSSIKLRVSYFASMDAGRQVNPNLRTKFVSGMRFACFATVNQKLLVCC